MVWTTGTTTIFMVILNSEAPTLPRAQVLSQFGTLWMGHTKTREHLMEFAIVAGVLLEEAAVRQTITSRMGRHPHAGIALCNYSGNLRRMIYGRDQGKRLDDAKPLEERRLVQLPKPGE